MILYLMRHGIAEDRSLLGSDADRKLTQQGTLRTAVVAKGLHRIGLRFDRIISSPYVRAKETAEIVARITGYEGDIMLDDRLVPFARFEDVNDLIQENNDAESLLFTGHEPSMGMMISGLSADGQLSMEVKKASVTAVQIDRFKPRAAGSLLWSIPPKLFEAISK